MNDTSNHRTIHTHKPTLMNKLIIVANLGWVKAYLATQQDGDNKPSIELNKAVDLPDLHSRYASRDTDEVGRFPQGSPCRDQSGMSYGERHNEALEAERSQLDHMVQVIVDLMESRQDCEVLMAIPKTIHDQVLARIPEERSLQIERTLELDLVKASKADLLRRFQLVHQHQ